MELVWQVPSRGAVVGVVWGWDMSKKELLINELERVPEPLLEEILDFVHFLKTKIIEQGRDIAVASESSLKRDWLRPEEEEAWQSL